MQPNRRTIPSLIFAKPPHPNLAGSCFITQAGKAFGQSISRWTCLLVLVIWATGCSTVPPASVTDKIEFDLDQLDADGLRGPTSGKVALDYEFKIPDSEANRREVRAIDPSVNFMAGSRGRIGAGEGECLCIGSSHQPRAKQVVLSLARLPYIERIIECHYE